MLTRVLYITTTALTVVAPSVAFAQEARPAAEQSTSTDGGVGDIIVTAERRATSQQRTSISIQTYTGDDLVKRGVTDVTALSATDSSVNIGYSTGMPVIAVRGISSNNATEAGDPAVSVATDGIFTNRPYGLFGGLYDIERVEILRGPQGTLFGRNSTGGALNILTKRAEHKDEGQISGEIGNYDLIGGQGFANFIVNDWLDARASFNFRSRSGYRNNSPARSNGDDEDLKSGRFQLAFHPTERLSGWILAQYTQQGGVGQVNQQVPFTFVNGVDGEPVHNKPANLGNGRNFPVYAPYVRDLKSTDLRGGLTYEFDGGVSINYLAGYNVIKYYRQQSQNGGYYTGDPSTPLIYSNTENPKTLSQELRLSSAPGAPFTWQAGGYFFREVSSVNAYTTLNPFSTLAQRGVEFDYRRLTSTSKALFGQVGYQITDEIKVSGGGRYTWDKRLCCKNREA